jgi:hypothetical protein
MKCTCDSRDLFNFGCRCKKEERKEVIIQDFIDELAVRTGYTVNLPDMNHKLVTKARLEAAMKAQFLQFPSVVIENLAEALWKELK